MPIQPRTNQILPTCLTQIFIFQASSELSRRGLRHRVVAEVPAPELVVQRDGGLEPAAAGLRAADRPTGLRYSRSLRCFEDAFFENAFFENAFFENANFENAFFENAFFENAFFENAFFENTFFENAFFENFAIF